MTPQDPDRARFEGLAAEDRARFQRESAQKDQEVGMLNETRSGVIGNSRGTGRRSLKSVRHRRRDGNVFLCVRVA